MPFKIVRIPEGNFDGLASHTAPLRSPEFERAVEAKLDELEASGYSCTVTIHPASTTEAIAFIVAEKRSKRLDTETFVQGGSSPKPSSTDRS